MDLSQLFWSASAEEISQGYIHDGTTGRFICLVCGREFIEGIIYPDGDLLYEAGKAVERHITREHSSMFDYLLNMGKQYTGLTDLQRDLLSYFHKGYSDKEIAGMMGAGSTSTIRNHRFKLKEKEKQAKVFLALMNLLAAQPAHTEQLIPIHRGAKMVDERYAITEEERRKLIEKHFEAAGEGALIAWPNKEKRKIVVLQHIARRFEAGRKYTEKEVNEVLRAIYHDYVTLRRYLIEYGFMDRVRDGSAYWVKL